MSVDAKAIYQQLLAAMLAAERQGLAEVRAHLDELGDHKDYALVLRHHTSSTSQQVDRLEKAIAEVGGASPAADDDDDEASGTTTPRSVLAASAPTPILANLYAGYAFLYEQIAAYTSLEIVATAAGFAGHKAWIEQAIKEERDTAQRVDKLIGSVTRGFLAREG